MTTITPDRIRNLTNALIWHVTGDSDEFPVDADDLLTQTREALAVVQGLVKERDRLAARVAELEQALRNIHQRSEPPGDWACAECRPQSDIIKPGFRCGFHAATALLEDPDHV